MKYKHTYKSRMKKLFFILLIMLFTLACTMSNQTSGAIRPEPTASQAPELITLHSSPTPEATASHTPESETMCQVKTGLETGLLNLRDGPSMSYQPLEILQEGDPLTLLEDPARDGWIKIKSLSFQGWVNSKYVQCEKE